MDKRHLFNIHTLYLALATSIFVFLCGYWTGQINMTYLAGHLSRDTKHIK